MSWSNFMGQKETEEYARGMYERVNQKWRDTGSRIFDGACGFSILGGPPRFGAELLTAGPNPGFGADDHQPHVEASWPKRSCLLHGTWHLPNQLRSIFKAGLEHILEGAVHTNFLFFKSSTIKKPSRSRWNSLPKPLRDELQDFCFEELKGYVKVSQPNAILVLSTDAFDKHATNPDTLLRDKKGKRRLLMQGQIFGVSAYGVIHPTGARVDGEDWPRAARCIAKSMG
jgi:hypothetical protein